MLYRDEEPKHKEGPVAVVKYVLTASMEYLKTMSNIEAERHCLFIVQESIFSSCGSQNLC